MADLSYTESDMPVTIVDDSGDGNIVQISSAGGGSLKIDGSAVTQPTSAPGTVSVGNSTTTTLGSNGVFTGTFENVKDYAYVSLIIFADQASATSGLSMQWSPDGVNVDRTENSNLTASSGRAFAMQVRAQYFRVVYTNGTIAQGIFRLNTNYHVTGTGLITRPLTTAVNTDNFALLTLSATAGQNVSGTTLLPITTTAQGSHQALDVNVVPVTSTIPSAANISSLVASNLVYTCATSINMATSGTDNPLLLIKNPGANTTTLWIYSVSLGLIIANNAANFLIWYDPTVTANGTTFTPVSNNVGGGAPASAMQVFTLPTTTADGTELSNFFYGQNSNSINYVENLVIAVKPGHSLLLTGNPINSNNRAASITIVWVEQ